MSSDGPTSWPTFGSEELDWSAADDDYGPRASRSLHSGPYRAAVPPRIADADLSLPRATVALVTEASAEIARFDGEALGSTTSFAALLLRTEAASSSQIEDLSSSPKAIALAELGRRGRANADQIVANVAAMTEALRVAARLDAEAILAMHSALMAHHATAVFPVDPSSPCRPVSSVTRTGTSQPSVVTATGTWRRSSPRSRVPSSQPWPTRAR